jgi:hypothetical protein
MKGIMATTSVTIKAPRDRVWRALVNPEEEREHSEKNREMMLAGLKRLVEGQTAKARS